MAGIDKMAGGAGGGEGSPAQPPSLWDPVVRVTHWGVAGAVVLNGLIVKPGGVAHFWAGWVVLALLVLRLVWGFVGPAPSRLSSFLPDPVGALRHLAGLMRGHVRDYPSHNPAGALMVWALWASLAVVMATGLWMTEGKTPMRLAEEQAAVAAGDWSVLIASAGDEDQEAGEMIEELHEVFANLVLLLAALHLAGVVLESRVLGRNLLRAMTIGPKSGGGA